ncbi:MAG: hypothetical protein HUJ61_04170, partial [Bacilli bacterium]|nr:hypothetical protein [Bacilli bacterium]
MFGNLRTTQPDVCSQLQDLVKAVPNALLFYGSPFTGRMYASLQLCKVLEVPSDNIIILSDRNHSDRILTALKLYRKNRNNSAKLFLKENVSVLLQQYHGALLDATTATGKKKFSDAAEAIDLLAELDTCNESEADKLADKLEKALLPLMDNKSALSVGQVRAIRDWCNTTSMDGQQKYVIIEGVENASDSAINALLKTLEEPPEGCHFILISSNAGRIPATILSRVRKLRFNDLGETQKKSILNSLFVNANDY